MRLTLRTLLAYMDGILEPADAEDLKQKIDESEFARDLSARVQDVTRRAGLSAPKVDSRGMALDANTVAEYLDNTLASERVPDFEMVCLESDVHLAEVAAAHQILTLVLGEPANVDPASRQKMYSLINRPAPAAAPAPETNGDGGKTTKPARKRRRRPKPEVPDYLRESVRRSRMLTAFAVVAALFLLTALAAFAVVNRDRLAMFFAPEPAAEAPAETDVIEPQAASDDIESDDIEAAPAAAEPASRIEDEPDAAAAVVPAPVEAEAVPAVETPTETEDAAPALEQPSAILTLPRDETPAPAVAAEAETDAPEAPLPADTLPPPGDAETAVPPVAGGAVDGSATPPAEAEVGGIGRVTSDAQEVLLRKRGDEEWVRLASRSMIVPGDRLVCPPGFRTSIALANGVAVQIFGGTIVDVAAPGASSTPSIEVVQGRVILLTIGRDDARLAVIAGNAAGEIVFEDGDASVALSVRREAPLGLDPETTPAIVHADLFASSGRSRWLPADGGAERQLVAPAHIPLPAPATTEDAEQAAAQEVVFPNWIAGDDRTDLERRGAAYLDQELRSNRPVTLTLRELVGNRRREVSMLAARSLALIDVFDYFTMLLRVEGQPPSWTSQLGWSEQIASLRAALARGPESASAMRTMFEDYAGPRGRELYRMLWGYTDEQLRSGDAAMLIEALDDTELDRRVLAFWNLYRVAGFNLGYYPELPPVKRPPIVQKWRQRLESGALLPARPAADAPAVERSARPQ